MTDHLHPDPHPDDLDELASAHLDDMTSAEEAARVAADPALLARVEQLRAVRDAVAALPPIDTARREAAIAASLAAFAEEGAASASAAPVAPVTSLAAVAARRRSPTRALRLMGAVAAVVLLAALVPLLGKLGGSDDDAASADRSETVDAAGGVAGDAGDGGESAPAVGSATPDATNTTVASQAADLGRFEDLAGLVASLADQDTTAEDAHEPTALTEGGFGAGCPSERARYSRAEGTRVEVATATVAEDRVIVLVVTASDGARSVEVLDAGTCAVLLEREL